MDEIRIRPERDQEAAAIAAVIRTAFGRDAEADLVARLRAAGALTISLVALQDDALVGHVALSPLHGEAGPGGTGWLGLAPLAVRPEWQRRGRGARLVTAALAAAETHGATLVAVLGDPAYYGRFGFVPAHRHGWRCVWDVPPELFQIRPTGRLGAMPPPGTLHYHDAFSFV